MHVEFTEDQLAFREEVRTFFREKFPPDLREKQMTGVTLTRDDMVGWQKILYQQGWAAVNWPVEYGGTGWSTIQKYIFSNEIAAAALALAVKRPGEPGRLVARGASADASHVSFR